MAIKCRSIRLISVLWLFNTVVERTSLVRGLANLRSMANLLRERAHLAREMAGMVRKMATLVREKAGLVREKAGLVSGLVREKAGLVREVADQSLQRGRGKGRKGI